MRYEVGDRVYVVNLFGHKFEHRQPAIIRGIYTCADKTLDYTVDIAGFGRFTLKAHRLETAILDELAKVLE